MAHFIIPKISVKKGSSDRVIELLQTMVKHTRSETENKEDSNCVWGIEKYGNKAALYETHVNSPEFKTFAGSLKSEGLLTSELALDNYSESHGFLSRSSNTGSPSGTFVWIAEVVLKDAASRDTAIELSKPLVQYVEDHEPKTLSYLFLKSLDDDKKMTVFEQYENKEALTGIHHKSDAFLAFGKKLGDSGMVLGKQSTGFMTNGTGYLTK